MKRKLTDDQVVSARKMYADGSSLSACASLFGISARAVYSAIKGETYADVPGKIEKLRGRSNNNWSRKSPKQIAAHMNKMRESVPDGFSRGSLNGRAILDEDDAKEVRAMLFSGKTCREIASIFGIAVSAVSRIRVGKSWGHLGGKIELPRGKGGCRQGETHYKSKLSDLQVSWIKWHLLKGVAAILLAKYFKVTRNHINDIARKNLREHAKPRKPPASVNIFARETETTIRLRGDRLAAKFDEVTSKKPRKKQA